MNKNDDEDGKFKNIFRNVNEVNIQHLWKFVSVRLMINGKEVGE